MNCQIASLLSDVENRFDLTIHQWDHVQQKETTRTGLLNNVSKLETSRGSLCLKLYGHGNVDKQELLDTIKVTEHLFSHRYAWLSRYYTDQSRLYLIPSSSGVYTLSDWIKGISIDMQYPLHRKAVARSLASFHKASEGYSPWADCTSQYAHTDHRLWETWIKEFTDAVTLFEQAYEKLMEKSDKQTWENRLVECFPNYLEEARAMCDRAHHLKQDYEKAINIVATKQGFIHDDLGLGNIVIAHDGTAYLIDFEGCHQKPRWHDLYVLLIGLDILNFPDAQYVQDILSVYHAHYPLTPQEEVIIPLLVSPIFHLRWFLNLVQQVGDVVPSEQLRRYYYQSSGNVVERIRFRREVETILAKVLRSS